MTNEGNKNAFRHGAASAEKALEKGTPMTGPAASAEIDARAGYEQDGAAAMILHQACRLEACASLYWDALLAAVTARDLDKVDTYAARFGWLANSSIRAWAEVERHNKHGKGARALEALAKDGE